MIFAVVRSRHQIKHGANQPEKQVQKKTKIFSKKHLTNGLIRAKI